MQPYTKYPLLPETEVEGFVFGTITTISADRTSGAGFLQGPDGSRAGLQWELADSPYIMRIDPPGQEHWGVYRVGFTIPVSTAGDLRQNLAALLDRLKILHRRARQM